MVDDAQGNPVKDAIDASCHCSAVCLEIMS